MTNNEETELRNAASYLRKQIKVSNAIVQVSARDWASMLERAADRIADLEAHLERLVA